MQEQTNKTKRTLSRIRSFGSDNGKKVEEKKSIYDKLVDIEDLIEMIARHLVREAKAPKNPGGTVK